MVERCFFCEGRIQDQGLGFYQHVANHPVCDHLWTHWKREIPHDHGGG